MERERGLLKCPVSQRQAPGPLPAGVHTALRASTLDCPLVPTGLKCKEDWGTLRPCLCELRRLTEGEIGPSVCGCSKEACKKAQCSAYLNTRATDVEPITKGPRQQGTRKFQAEGG